MIAADSDVLRFHQNVSGSSGLQGPRYMVAQIDDNVRRMSGQIGANRFERANISVNISNYRDPHGRQLLRIADSHAHPDAIT